MHSVYKDLLTLIYCASIKVENVSLFSWYIKEWLLYSWWTGVHLGKRGSTNGDVNSSQAWPT